MQTKSHLSLIEREKIEYYRRLGMGIRMIGRKMCRDHSVISREIRRNNGHEKRYRATIAGHIAGARRGRRKGRKLERDTRLHDFVVREIRRDQSPDVIAGRIKAQPPRELKGSTISHESIYQFIYEGEGRWEGLYQHLRNKQSKRRAQRSRTTQETPRIQERISIHERPEEIMTRTSFGHWESDSVIYTKQKPILSVQLERKSRLVRFHRARNKTAEETERAIRKTIESLSPHCFKTMTFDNGTEGARHTVIRDEYGIMTYFCDTYSSWQKGAVENVNRIIRRFLPKTKDLSVLTDREIHEIQERINDTPRKSLGYRTPNEVIRQYEGWGGALLP